MNGYNKIRRFGSDVHIYEFNQRKEEPRLEFGITGKLEPLSKIGNTRPNEKITAKINFGFFNFDASSENLGTFSDGWTTVNYGKDTVIRFYDGEMLTPKQIETIKAESLWYAGASYTLLENGKVSIRNTPKFPHYLQCHPRTILGQKNNLNILLIAVQGRRVLQRGMTAWEEALLCRELGLWNAVNCDGGGSSEMIVNGKIMNKPTDGRERAIGSAICVYA